ncbi:MAG: phage portal protein [Planctomycetes bacterium]|nr:phage portal protein [Planctomycetota bacterium]
MKRWLSNVGGWFKRSFFDNPANWGMFGQMMRPPALAGVSMDEQSALLHLPVYAAVNRIATDVSLLDISLERRLPEGGRRVALDDVLFPLLTHSPDGLMTARRWRAATVGHLLTWGNSYSEIEYDLAGRVRAFHLLHPDAVEPQITGDGELVYHYSRPNGGGSVDLEPADVLHFAGLTREGIKGYSPIAMARETLALGRAADVFGAAFFGNAARPSGVLEHPGKLGDAAKRNLRESFAALQSGPTNTGRIIVAEEGMKWANMSIPPEDAQFLETRKFSVLDVCRLYGIPPNKLGDYSDAHYANLEEANADYLQTTLLGWCSVLESEIEFKLLRPEQRGEYFVRHDFKPLLRPNAVARAQYSATAIQWGWLSRNEVRDDEGEAPAKGLDTYLLPLNFQQVDRDGKLIPNAAPAASSPAMSATDPNTQQQSGALPTASAFKAA